MKKEDFLVRARKLYGNKYNYSDVPDEFLARDKITIICPVHGAFEQRACNHLDGHQCSSCRGGHFKSVKNWIIDLKKVHGDEYDYSLITDPVSAKSIVKIICKMHGVFEQSLTHHKSGEGCQKCGGHALKTRSEWIDGFKDNHKEKYNYHLVCDGIKSHDFIDIECPVHGIFSQAVYAHQAGAGCPACGNNKSFGEKEIFEIIRKYLPDTQKRAYPDFMSGKELDIYSPARKLAIEYCGMYWHSEKWGGKKRNYHRDKMLACNKAGVRLITIWDWEWLNKPEQVKDILLNACGQRGLKIRADKCRIEKIDAPAARVFYDENHIQGFTKASFHYALFGTGENKDALLGCMSFGKGRYADGWELIRFAVKRGYNIPYAASRLFNAFLKESKAEKVRSYCDLRLFTGGLYKALGFKQMPDSPPCYYYMKKNPQKDRYYHRSFFMKHKLKDKLEVFDESKSEWENMQINGWDRIFDCGCGVWEWEK